MKQLRIEPRAEADIREACLWYAGQREGLDLEFQAALESCLDLICRHPMAYQEMYRELRRGLLRRFPYGVFYLVEEDAIVVLACLHLSQHPRRREERLN